LETSHVAPLVTEACVLGFGLFSQQEMRNPEKIYKINDKAGNGKAA